MRRERRYLLPGLLLLWTAALLPLPAFGQAATTTVVNLNPTGPQVFSSPVTITATVSSGSAVPTGTVQFFDVNAGQNIGTAITLAPASPNSATASLTISTLLPYTHTVQATYTPDYSANFSGSIGSNSYTVNQIDTLTNPPFTITTNPTTAPTNQAVQFTIMSCVNPTVLGCNVGFVPQGGKNGVGGVTLHVGGVFNQELPLSSGSVTFTVPANLLSPGPQSVSLDYSEASPVDPWGSYTGVTTTTYTYTTPQTIAFGALTNQTYGVSPFTISATASSGLTVSFNSTTTSVCTVLGNTVTIVGTGPCSITASQGGNSTYAPAPSVTQGFTVSPASQTITFGPLGNQTYGIAPFTISATASSGLTVSFSSTTTSVCTVSGSTVTIAGAGPCSITASQAGNANYNAAAGVTQSFTVNPASQTITFGPLGNQTYGVAPFTIGATASSGLTVNFNSTTTSVCTVLGNTVTIAGTGPCSITASQAGNANYNAAPSVTQGFTVNSGSQTITFGALPNLTYGAAPFTLSATASSGLTVSFASTTSSICTVAGVTVTVIGAGNCSITASQGGNANYGAATSVPQSFTVGKALLTATANNASKVDGAALPVFSSSITGFVNGDTLASAVTGAPSLTCSATATSTPGSYTIAVAIGTLAAANYTFAFTNGTLTITKANSSTLLTSSGGIMTATVSAIAPGAGTPTGTVQFMSGAASLATVTLVGGKAILNTTLPSGGTLTAVYLGDTNFNSSSSNTMGTPNSSLATCTITLTSSLNPANLGQSITFTAVLACSGPGLPTGTVQFLDGTKLMGTVPLSANQATYTTSSLGGGVHNIVAIYSGDAAFSSAQAVYGQTVYATVTMDFTGTPSLAVYGQTVTLTATVGPTTAPPGFAPPSGQVTFQEGNTVLGTATLVAGVASITVNTLPLGNNVITATYSGDSTWTSATRTITVSVTIAPSVTSLLLTLNSSSQVVLTATVKPVAPNAGIPTGSIQFRDTSNNAVVTNAALSNGTVSITLTIPAANRAIAAFYGGDGDFQASTSMSLPVTYSGVGISATSFAPEEVVSIFNVAGLSGDTPGTLPLQTTLGSTSVKILDSAGTSRAAQLYGAFASSGQINLVIPTGTAIGPALVTITLPGGGTLNTALQMTPTAPGIFTANMNGQGIYAGQVVHVHADGSQTVNSSAVFDSNQSTYVPQAIAMGPSTDEVFLVLYGTGIRGAAAGQVSATVGGNSASLYYVGPQPSYPGLDQINLQVPAGMAGAGTVNVVLTVNGQAANTVTVAFQ